MKKLAFFVHLEKELCSKKGQCDLHWPHTNHMVSSQNSLSQKYQNKLYDKNNAKRNIIERFVVLQILKNGTIQNSVQIYSFIFFLFRLKKN